MNKWKLLNKNTASNPQEIINIILKNRNLDKVSFEEFTNPDYKKVDRASVSIDEKNWRKAHQRIRDAIAKKERVIIYGDYDADGICGSAILWEALFQKNENVMPYIPDRYTEGYGLSTLGIENVLKKYPDTKLIITVDNGISASDAVNYGASKNIDVIITDHHTRKKKDPNAHSLIYTTSLSGAGIAWLIAKEYVDQKKSEELLELVAIAAIADLVPLIGPNRALVKKGIEMIRNSTRPGF